MCLARNISLEPPHGITVDPVVSREPCGRKFALLGPASHELLLEMKQSRFSCLRGQIRIGATHCKAAGHQCGQQPGDCGQRLAWLVIASWLAASRRAI